MKKTSLEKVAPLLAGYLRSNNIKTLLIRRNPEYDVERREDFTVMERGPIGKIKRKIGNLTGRWNNFTIHQLIKKRPS